MTLAVQGIVELFRAVKREDEVNRKILAFSVSHDHRSVRIYSHYPVITEKDIKYYWHLIRDFSFTELDSKDKWAAYRFTKNVAGCRAPQHPLFLRTPHAYPAKQLLQPPIPSSFSLTYRRTTISSALRAHPSPRLSSEQPERSTEARQPPRRLSCDKTIRVWDAATGAEPRVLQDQKTALRLLSFSSCGKHLVTDRGTLQLDVSKTERQMP